MLIILDEMTNPQIIDTEESPGLDHIYCEICHPNADVALCGTDVSDLEERPDWKNDDDLCVVCDDIDLQHKHPGRDY